ncbi:Cytochrome C' [endosymbiont of Ridgeia piscesae]|uniref:Cytochrome C n=2 Tax=endosymbiont of Ridgeia piscesae TaxID=54398 RepID=A0A0T5YTP1_9GAMM|nr:Cytochrome C' [endosymbiont of Ridgeia piscesae]KRT59872.1 Cytochrome C' [endosymbiont of Ridgeia piscesae]
MITRTALSLLLSTMILLLSSPAQAETVSEKTIRLPPTSLAAWYRPDNKRQVWLHNMFKLRREMLAVSDYLALEDAAGVAKWSERLAQHYRKIGEMVPEWQEELEADLISQLQQSAQQGNYEEAARSLRKLGLNCRSCHRDYRAVTAAIYRTPDFSQIHVEDSETLEEEPYRRVMERLTLLVNRIKIASEDERMQTALDSLDNLRQRLDDLGQSCESCHKDKAPKSRILGTETEKSLAALEQAIKAGEQKKTGRHLGTLAVQACARCHSVHRTLYGLKGAIAP